MSYFQLGGWWRSFQTIPARARVTRRELLLAGLFALAHAGLELVSMNTLYPVLTLVEGGAGATLNLGWPFDLLPRLLTSLGYEVSLTTLLILVFLPTLAKQMTGYAKAFYLARMGHRCRCRIQSSVAQELIEADTLFYVSHNRGELNAAIMSHGLRAGSAAPAMADIVGCALLLVSYVAALFLLAPQLAALVICVGLLINQLSHRLVRRGGHLANAMTQEIQKLAVMVNELIQGMRLIKMRGMEDDVKQSIGSQLGRICDANINVDRTRTALEAIISPLLLICAVIVFYVSVKYFMFGLSALGMFALILMRTMPIISEVNVHRFRLQDALAGMQALDELNGRIRRHRRIASGDLPFSGLRRHLVFENVSFSYESTEPSTFAVKDLTFEIARGEMIALVGRSGAGKSTTIDLIPRFIDPCAGRITIDGTPLSDFDLSGLRRAISLVSQDAAFFDVSIRQNLNYGLDQPLSDKHLREVLDSAHCLEFIDALPAGIDTVVGERGVRLSGGQRQRLAFARALVNKPDLLILDEPTSALDSESENAIQETLAELQGKLTILIIAHRLATIRRAGRILVMQAGTVVESGCHDELMERQTIYRQLFQLQSC